jgi:hypothetical protein
MGVILFVELEREVPNLKDDLGGKGWARADVALDGLARELGLTPIADLTSMSAEGFAELAEEFGGPADLDFREEWFDPADGIRTVEGLLAHLEAHPEVAKGWDHPGCYKAALNDMREALKVLRAARGEGIRFHFAWAY